MFDISEMLKEKSKMEEFLSFQAEHSAVPVFVWGAGDGCKAAVKFLQNYRIPVKGIIDKNCAELIGRGGG